MVYDRNLGKSFKKIGKIYDLGRRDYPKRLINDIVRISKIKTHSVILDIGCGTGKSTIPFVKEGYRIIGIDISDRMLKIAKKLSFKYKNVKYRKISFEKSNFIQKSFDLILVGTAIHWLDPKIFYKKAYRLLRKEGHIAIFLEPVKSLDKKIKQLKMREIFLGNCPNYPRNPNTNVTIGKIKTRLIKTKMFQKPILKKYTLIREYNKEDFCILISSYSWVISLNQEKKEKLMKEVNICLDKIKEPLIMPTKIYLIIAKSR